MSENKVDPALSVYYGMMSPEEFQCSLCERPSLGGFYVIDGRPDALYCFVCGCTTDFLKQRKPVLVSVKTIAVRGRRFHIVTVKANDGPGPS